MTICSITSGLGNQLFQYVAGLHWTRSRGEPLRLDTSWFLWQKHSPKRFFRLRQLGVTEQAPPIRITAALLLARALRGKSPAASRALVSRLCRMDTVSERDFHRPDPRFSDASRRGLPTWLDGYWQTADHFLSVQDLVRQRLKPVFAASEGFHSWRSEIRGSRGVAVHVRRGDYATVGHGMLTPAYYSSAASHFPAATCWFVFSEDLDWCRNHIALPGEVRLVEYDSRNRDIEDLLLMAECQGNVIANSSYSWWGAALGDPADRTVVAPRYRHGPDSGDVQEHRLPGAWVRIDEF